MWSADDLVVKIGLIYLCANGAVAFAITKKNSRTGNQVKTEAIYHLQSLPAPTVTMEKDVVRAAVR